MKKNIINSQIEFEIKQNLLFRNLKSNQNLLLQQISIKKKSYIFKCNTSVENQDKIHFSTKNPIKVDNPQFLNNKIKGENIELNNDSSSKKPKIFDIKKVTDRKKEEFEEKKLKKYIYRGSKYRGVSRNGKTWQVLIMINRNKNYIGNFKTEDEAAKAYDEYAMKFHKNKARLNFFHQGFITYENKF